VESRFQTTSDLVRDLRSAVLSDVGELDTLAGLPAKPRDTKQLSTLKRKIEKQQKPTVSVWGWLASGTGLVGIILTGLLASGVFNMFGATPQVMVTTTPTNIPTTDALIGAVTEVISDTPTVVFTETPFTPTKMLGGGSGSMIFVSGPDNKGNIYLADLACASRADLCGPGAVQLTNNATNNRGPILSPDGSRIAFRSEASGNRDIYVMDADGTDVIQLTNDPYNDYSPAWSPDSEKIAFISERAGNPEIYVMDADGLNQTRLTHNTMTDFYPAWSPDGKWIAFYSRRNFNTDIYLLKAECVSAPESCDVGQMRLTNDAGHDYEPSWSLDSNLIAFVSERDGNPEIYVMNADGTNQQRLTKNDFADKTPAFSPDGEWIAFVSRRQENYDIYLITVEGTRERRITSMTESEYDPSWLP
jgi:dipeptidyl aminopeptidase/acylaminoacyl peptidase